MYFKSFAHCYAIHITFLNSWFARLKKAYENLLYNAMFLHGIYEDHSLISYQDHFIYSIVRCTNTILKENEKKSKTTNLWKLDLHLQYV